MQKCEDLKNENLIISVWSQAVLKTIIIMQYVAASNIQLFTEIVLYCKSW